MRSKRELPVYETLKMVNGDKKILDTFLNKCLKQSLRINWPQKYEMRLYGKELGWRRLVVENHQKEKMEMDRTRCAYGKEQARAGWLNLFLRIQVARLRFARRTPCFESQSLHYSTTAIPYKPEQH